MKNNKRIEKKNLKLGIGIAILVILLISLGSWYIIGEQYYKNHFAKGTVINGINVSKLTVEKLNNKISEYTLTIIGKTDSGDKVEESIVGKEIGLELASIEELKEILEAQRGGKWISNKRENIQINNLIKLDKRMWKQKKNNLQSYSKEFVVEPVDAHISEYDENTNNYIIIPEVQGNKLNRRKTEKVLIDAIKQLDKKVNLVELDCYEKPKVLKDDLELNNLLSNLNQFVDVTITYTFGKNTEVLDGDTIHKWLIRNEDSSITLERDSVKEYVASLRKKYDTIFRPRTFQTSYGKTVTLNSGDYGWWMNYDQEANELAAMIESFQSGDRTPVYYQTAAEYGERDYGDTYIEINLTAQHMFYYEKGKLVLESDFVSGNVSRGYETPAGVSGITYKERNATLVGENYKTPVSYWMPFNGNIGLHDATWRDTFGKDLYLKSGSHGCVNLPYLVAKELYSKISKGTPVITYNLDGTESTSVTTQSGEEIVQSVNDRIDEIGNVTKDSKKAIERARQLYDKLSYGEKKMVTNYNVLLDAEKVLKEKYKQ